MFYDLNFPQWYEGNRNTGGDGNEQPRDCSNWKLYECSKNRYIWKYYLDKEKRILPENATEESSMTDPEPVDNSSKDSTDSIRNIQEGEMCMSLGKIVYYNIISGNVFLLHQGWHLYINTLILLDN